jgi:hypothetical protein
MFELEVDVQVRLSSGAQITLSDAQKKTIKNTVVEVVLGAPQVVAKKPTRKGFRKSNTHWSTVQDLKLMDIVNAYAHLKRKEHSRDRAVAIRKYRVAVAPEKTIAAVNARYHALANKKKKEQAEIAAAADWNPIALTRSN